MDIIRSIVTNRIIQITLLVLGVSLVLFLGYKLFWPHPIKLTVFPQNASITLNGKNVTLKNGVIRAKEGTYMMTISADQYKPRTLTVSTDGPEDTPIAVALNPLTEQAIKSYQTKAGQQTLRDDDLQNNGIYKKIPFTATVDDNEITFTQCPSIRYQTQAICYESDQDYSITDIQKILVNYSNYANTSIYDLYKVKNDNTLIYEDNNSDVYFIDGAILARTNTTKEAVIQKLHDMGISTEGRRIDTQARDIMEEGE